MHSSKLEDLLEPETHSEIETQRHSCAHIMAHAVQKLWPDAKFGIGPTIEDGFYYDMVLSHTITPEDLPKIEKEMKAIVSKNVPFVRKELPFKAAAELFKKMNQPFKVEIIEALQNAAQSDFVSLYEEGEFTDLCRGPHIASTGKVGAFKLLSIAGAYWRGNEKNPQMQRIYGTAFPTQEALDEHLRLIEEAKKRDHRKLGKELDLFSFHPEAPASPFFHPKGAVIYNRLTRYVRELYAIHGYEEIITPQIMDVALWKKSGHYDNYRESMYFTEVDERQFAVKPMNCPASTFVYSAQKRSYRDLPLRMADFGRLHRYEKSGVLAGLTRVRTFCQDDAHVFCTPAQIEGEILKVAQMILDTYELFGFEQVRIALSTRPEKRVGSDSLWDQAEAGLKHALEKLGRPYDLNAGDGAFYGPKIDFRVQDALKRAHQLGTIQLDFIMPERFELSYTSSENRPEQPVMIHRAILGSIERFMGILTEHCAGAFPFWLSPLQARLIPVQEAHVAYCYTFATELKKCGYRVEVDDRNESLGLKTRETQMQKIPFALVAGQREIEGGGFALRKYGQKDSQTLGQAEILALFKELESHAQPKAHEKRSTDL